MEQQEHHPSESRSSGAAKGLWRRLYQVLASWKLSVVLTLSGFLYFVFLSIWGARSPAHVVHSISSMSPFLLFYVLLLTNTTLCIAARLPALWSATRRRPVLLAGTPDWQDETNSAPAARGTAVRVDDGYLWVYRRYSSLGTLLLHGSLLLVALGFLLSHLSHVEASVNLGQRQGITLDASTYRKVTPQGRNVGALPVAQVNVHEVAAEYWEDELLFTSFTAELDIDGRKKAIAINDPIFLSPFTYLRLTSFGYAPVFMVLVEGREAPVEEGAAMLNVFPPGNRDLLRLQSFPHRIYLRLYPDWQEIDGQASSRSMRLDNPRIVAEVYRGKVFVARRTLRFGEPLPVEAFSFSVLGVLPSVELTMVHDLGLPFILLGFLVFAAGAVLRLPGKRGEILATELPDGSWRVVGKNVPEIHNR